MTHRTIAALASSQPTWGRPYQRLHGRQDLDAFMLISDTQLDQHHGVARQHGKVVASHAHAFESCS